MVLRVLAHALASAHEFRARLPKFLPQPLDNIKPTNHQQNGPLIVSIPQSTIELINTDPFSVPTHNDIAVPESALKKQKAHQKTTDSQAADLKKKREV